MHAFSRSPCSTPYLEAEALRCIETRMMLAGSLQPQGTGNTSRLRLIKRRKTRVAIRIASAVERAVGAILV